VHGVIGTSWGIAGIFYGKEGYGFITDQHQKGGRDVFVHYSDIEEEGYRELRTGDVVKYLLVKGPNGLKALQVKLLCLKAESAAYLTDMKWRLEPEFAESEAANESDDSGRS